MKPVGILRARSQPSEGEAGFLPSGSARAFGLVGGLMTKREIVEYTDMEMYASWRMERYVCRSNKSILHCANDQCG
ncbi:hypothetical protein CA838_05835 [Eikenella corrodens]|nr:hypothetical protein CA838_05835 [Eikenella corrodens]